MKLSRRTALLIAPLLAWTFVSCAKQKESDQAGQAAGPPGTTSQAPSATPQVPPEQAASAAGLIPIARRAPAPQIDTQLVDGSSFSLARNRGKVVLVDFWATWCPPCRKAIPHLIDIQREYGSRGVQVIGISLDETGKMVIEPFVKSAGINYPIIADPQGNLANLYGGIDAIPALFMIDKSGRVAEKIDGYRPKETIESAVKSLLDES